ncbi:MAG: penicillin-binding protein, partial [Alphaproteobacteria bacterium]
MLRFLITLCLSFVALVAPARAAAIDAATLAQVDAIFSRWALDAHVPGMAYGVVADGRLVHF